MKEQVLLASILAFFFKKCIIYITEDLLFGVSLELLFFDVAENWDLLKKSVSW